MQLGIYQHYKGNQYEVIGVATDALTLEPTIVYRALYDSPKFGDHALWVRKASNFIELVQHDGKHVPRFH